VSEVDSMGITAVATTQLLSHVLGRGAPVTRDVEAVSMDVG
jgi:hypothetical protein